MAHACPLDTFQARDDLLDDVLLGPVREEQVIQVVCEARRSQYAQHHAATQHCPLRELLREQVQHTCDERFLLSYHLSPHMRVKYRMKRGS